MTSKCTIFADHVGSSKIFVHVNDDEMDTIPVYEEVFIHGLRHFLYTGLEIEKPSNMFWAKKEFGGVL